MRKLLLMLLFPVASFGATFPADITLSWVNAAEYVDNSPIEAGDLVSVRVEGFRHDDPVTPTFTATVPVTGESQPQSETFNAIPRPGTYTCYGYSIVVDNTESDRSNPAQRKYIGKPFPPVTFESN